MSSQNIYKFPNRWILFGSTDGETFSNLIDQQTLTNIITEYTCYTYQISDITDFKKIRLLILSTFGSIEAELCEFSLTSRVSGGRIIPVTLQPITQENSVTFGTRLGNSIDVYSGISVYNPEYISLKFPYYPGDIGSIV